MKKNSNETKNETRDGTEEVKQNHVESNPLYEAVLKDTLETIKNALMTLECSKVHSSDWHVWRTYRQLKRLRDRLTEGG